MHRYIRGQLAQAVPLLLVSTLLVYSQTLLLPGGRLN
jgi:hypothetical protein